MFTEIRCEICINHFVEIIFTLSCTVLDINLLQINCSQNFLLKMCKKIAQTSIGRYKKYKRTRTKDLFTLSCADTSGRCRDCYK